MLEEVGVRLGRGERNCGAGIGHVVGGHLGGWAGAGRVQIVNGTTTTDLHTIHLFRERKAYIYNMQTKVCEVRDEPNRFRHIRIPREVGTGGWNGGYGLLGSCPLSPPLPYLPPKLLNGLRHGYVRGRCGRGGGWAGRAQAHFIGEAIVGTNAFDNAGVLTTHWEHHNDTEKSTLHHVLPIRAAVGCFSDGGADRISSLSGGFNGGCVYHGGCDPGGAAHWFGVFTDRDIGCLPVSDHFHDERIGTVQTDFFDIVLGIGDPNIFIPDPSCFKAAPVNIHTFPSIHSSRDARRKHYF